MHSNLLVLALHRVGFPPENAKIKGLFTSPEILRFQLLLLEKLNYNFVTLAVAMRSPNKKNAVITFDDGYFDNYSEGLNILNEFGAPATIFVITEDVGKKGVVWNEAGEKLPADMMDWESLRDLQMRGWEIGSHGDEHIHLGNHSQARQEIVINRSIEKITDQIGVAPISFAYPYGSYSNTTKLILKTQGIKYAVTTKPADFSKRSKNDDLLEIGRCSIGGRKYYHKLKNMIRICKVTGIYEPFAALFSQPVPLGNMNPLNLSKVLSNFED